MENRLKTPSSPTLSLQSNSTQFHPPHQTRVSPSSNRTINRTTMDMTGSAVSVNRAPCTMMTSANSKSSQVVGNRIGAVSKICVKPRRELSIGFRDVGYVLYYKKAGITAMEMPSCGSLVDEKIAKKDEKKKLKKKMKLFKGLSKDLSMLSQAELVGEDDPEGISKAAETLLQHLDEMKRREKELKKKRKMEKSLMKAVKGAQCQSSSSSESSDSECGEVVDLKSMRLKSSIKPEASKNSALEVVSVVTLPSISQKLEKESCKSSFCNVTEQSKRIEVCMGGKCKKSGAGQLIEEFEKIVGEGAVVGCKCMGKCRDGPNVRVLSSEADVTDLGKIQSSSLSPPPLCVGVGLEDVGVIVANFLGGGDHVNLAMAVAT